MDKMGFALALAQAALCPEKRGEGCGQCLTCRRIEHGSYEDLYVVEPTSASGNKSKVLSVRDAQIEELQNQLKTRPSEGERNIAVISGADSMTMRAQTRLLKTLEEPYPGTIIMLLSENTEFLLPTIQSRCVKVRLIADPDLQEENRTAASELVEMIREEKYFFDIKERLDQEVHSRTDAYTLLDGLERVMEQFIRRGCDFMSVRQLAEAVSAIEKTRRAVQRNASYKYAVRHLVIQMERIVRPSGRMGD
jgi:DNA polymerase-3 subunit delta'